jgi:hypothetical protein
MKGIRKATLQAVTGEVNLRGFPKQIGRTMTFPNAIKGGQLLLKHNCQKNQGQFCASQVAGTKHSA